MRNHFRAAAFALTILVALMPGPAPAQSVTADLREVLDIQRIVETSWAQEKYAAIDALAEGFRTSGERTLNGFWKLTFIYLKFDEMQNLNAAAEFPDGYHWKRIHAWRQEFPNSPTAIIVESLMLAAQSTKFDPVTWVKNPAGSTPTVPVVDYLKAARELLEQHADIKASDPHWFTVRFRIRRLEREAPSALIAAHEEALRLHPSYMRTHFETFEHLIDAWYPDTRRIEAFANTVAAATEPKDGMAMYARLIVHAMPVLHQKQPYSLDGFNWPKIKSGLERILADYPSSWNANKFAMLACLARDKETAKPLFEHVSNDIRKDVWGSPIIYEQCKEWAEEL